MDTIQTTIDARDEAVVKAWKSLAGYKFLMFGYHAAFYVKFNRLLPKEHRVRNPFKSLVVNARVEIRTRVPGGWMEWINTLEALRGHELDGDQENDGYSLDYLLNAFKRGISPEQASDEITASLTTDHAIRLMKHFDNDPKVAAAEGENAYSIFSKAFALVNPGKYIQRQSRAAADGGDTFHVVNMGE